MGRKLLISFIFTLFSFLGITQSYLGQTTTTVNFRSEPNTSCDVIDTLFEGTSLFIISTEKVKGFYHALNIHTNEEGYVHGDYVNLIEEIPQNEESIFTATGTTDDEPELVVFNNTNIHMTLKMNDVLYSFSPHEKRTLKLSPGEYSYRASSSGVIPYHGKEVVKNGMIYEWEFYIVTVTK